MLNTIKHIVTCSDFLQITGVPKSTFWRSGWIRSPKPSQDSPADFMEVEWFHSLNIWQGSHHFVVWVTEDIDRYDIVDRCVDMLDVDSSWWFPSRAMLHALAALDDQTLITAWSLNEEQNLGSVGCYGSVDHVESGKSIWNAEGRSWHRNLMKSGCSGHHPNATESTRTGTWRGQWRRAGTGHLVRWPLLENPFQNWAKSFGYRQIMYGR